MSHPHQTMIAKAPSHFIASLGRDHAKLGPCATVSEIALKLGFETGPDQEEFKVCFHISA